MMRSSTLGLLMICFLISQKAVSQQQHVEGLWREVITREDLLGSGASRLSDVLPLVDFVRLASIEGYSWTASINGLSPLYEDSWQVFVDDVPARIGTLSIQNINLLPVTIEQIDSIEVFKTPVVISGQFVPSGALHIHTQRPTRGFGTSGSVAVGNETGDPGPYAFTGNITPNIDRIGPTYTVVLSASDGPTYFQAGLKSDQFHATDERILPRVLNLYQGQYSPRLLLIAPNLKFGTSSNRGHHQVSVGYTRFQDLPFIAMYGRETPVIENFSHIAASGTFNTYYPGLLTYDFAFSSNRLNERTNRRNLAFDWREDVLHGNIELTNTGRALSGALGASFDYLQAHTSSPLTDPSLLVTSTYGHLHWRVNESFEQYGTLLAAHSYDRISVKAITSTNIIPGLDHRLSLTLSFSRRAPEERQDLWYWMGKGYGPPVLNVTEIALPDFGLMSNTFTLDAGWTYAIHRMLSSELGILYRNFSHLQLASFDFRNRTEFLETGSETEYFLPSIEVHSDVPGRVIGFSARLNFTLSRHLRQSLTYNYLRPSSDALPFWRAWSSIPWHQAQYTILLTPDNRFSVFGRLCFRSSSYWPQFSDISITSKANYTDRLPSMLQFDISARKRFWKDYLAASLTLTNLINHPYRYHPVGAITNLAIHVKLLLQLDFLGEQRN